ncbi:hypothetical protein MACK_000538 [Theileria orientalis]|uniref:Uncharacterized protein n=1 Tax=Theileria orientalis TaxID=68886 RepID=A0A976MA34_THEOR|nr:hypothetical protein MACK_000538 [Theileria orientalis]
MEYRRIRSSNSDKTATTFKRSSESVTYTRDDRNDADQFEAKDTYLFKKVLNEGQFIWEATGNNYAKKLLVRKDEKGDPKLTVYYHQPIAAPAAFKNNQRYDNAAQKYQPGSLDALPYGPYPYSLGQPYTYGAQVPGGLGELTRTPVITASTPVVVVPRRRGSRLRVSDLQIGKKIISHSASDDGSGEKSPTEDGKSKGETKPRDKDADDDDIEVVEELMSPEESKGAEHGDKGGDKSGSNLPDSYVTGQGSRDATDHSEPRGDKREPRVSVDSLDSSKVDNVVLKDLMDLVKALKTDVDLIKETLKNRDFDTPKLSGMATNKQPSVPALVKEFSATGDSSSVKMYAFSPEDEGATGADGSQYGNKIVLTVGDHSNVYILDGNSNTMSVSTAKQEIDDDDEDEEGGKEGSKVENVYVNKSVPGALGTLTGTIPPHSNLFIGGQGMATPVVMPGIQHIPAHPPKTTTKGESTDDSPEDLTPPPASVPVSVPTPVSSAMPAAVTTAVPSAMSSAVPAPTSAGPIPKKKDLDADRSENDDEDLKVTNIYGTAPSPASTDDDSKPKSAPPTGGAMAAPAAGTPSPIAQPAPVDQAPMAPPSMGPIGAGLPMPPTGTPLAPPMPGPAGMAAPIPITPDGATLSPPPPIPMSLDPSGVPIPAPPIVPGAPFPRMPIPPEGQPVMPMPAFGMPITTGMAAIPPMTPGAPITGAMPPPRAPIVPPPGMAAPIPVSAGPMGAPAFGAPITSAPETGLSSEGSAPAPLVPGGPTPSEEE